MKTKCNKFLGKGTVMKRIKKGESSKDMKNLNRLLVLKLLCTEGKIKRSEIMTKTSLSKMTATNIAEDLMGACLIKETAVEEGAKGAGRRPTALTLSEKSPIVGGIYVGRKSCSVLFCDLCANKISEERREYKEINSAEDLILFITELFSCVKSKIDREILCVGISAPGPLDRNKGIILSPSNFFGINNLNIKEILENKLKLPCVLAHDTACAAQGELLYGKGKGMDSFLLVHLHNGIGSGIIVKGQLFDGAMGLGGELGHISIDHKGEKCSCGGRGCLENYANEMNLTADYNSISEEKLDNTSLKEIIKKVNEGDKAALFALDNFLNYLSAALVSALNFIDTHHIVLSYHGENGLIERMLEEKINSSLFAGKYRKIKVISSAFKGDAPIIGAAAAAAEEVFTGNIKITEEW